VASYRLEPYDLLRHDRLVLSREAAERLNHALSATQEKPAKPAASEAKAAPDEKKTAKTEKSAPKKPAAKAGTAKKAAPKKKKE
jgi:hypothetical protein